MHQIELLLLVLLLWTAVAKADPVCKVCMCSETTVNCVARNLQLHFNDSDWPSDMVITDVMIDNNQLVHVTQYPPLAVLRLSLSHNNIVGIDSAAFMHLQNLTELDLSHNFITSENLASDVFKGVFAPDRYQPLANLETLRLGSNAIHTLKSDLFEHIVNLRILTLDANPLRVLDQGTVLALSSLPYLEVLDLSYTDLKDLPEYLLHTPKNLKVLNLTGNFMTRVPSALEHSHALEVLHFSENPVVVLDRSSFKSDMPYLRELHMSYMENLTYIASGAMSKLTALQELYLSHNPRLSSIHPDTFSSRRDGEKSEEWPPIVKLDLGHNNLASLDRHLLGHWKILQYLNLVGNRWLCDCENQWMVSTLLPAVENITKYQIDTLECVEPEQMRGRKLHELEVRNYHMRCLDSAGNHPEKDAKMLVGILVGVLLAVPVTMIALLLFRINALGSLTAVGYQFW
ncbi:leucine-rich repeat-containing protein 70 isoform X4 [Cryptotermes secundus]|uniref:leucine-rich repeat-containing protein 70 isoform X4 n=1 Tax=Cryptotermes secundus TaxID=105785 RepID=UPI001454E070|nr:leucine-rich repeat-containing protein 70 isoform X4 [Cryptotermes secundus]